MMRKQRKGWLVEERERLQVRGRSLSPEVAVYT